MSRLTALEIAWIFEEIAELLEIKGESPYKIRAYRRAARTTQQMGPRIIDLARQGKLQSVAGFGSALEDKFEEILFSGQSRYHQELLQEIPPGLRDMLYIPGLGPKSVRQIYQGLGITTLEELREAAKTRSLRTLPGLGSKTEQAVLRTLELRGQQEKKINLGVAFRLAEEILGDLRTMPQVERAELVSSLRRGKEMVSDISILLVTEEASEVLEVISRRPGLQQAVVEGSRLSVRSWLGVTIIVEAVPRSTLALALIRSTGNQQHWQQLLSLASGKGLRVEDDRLWREGEELPLESEEDFYHYLGLPYIPPELREGQGEIQAAREGNLPPLLDRKDIKGDLHLHSDWSDGVNSLREMVEAAQSLGYQYVAFTDHSRSLVIARGLTPERLMEQQRAIRSLNEEYPHLTLLSGVEVDILAGGELDYPDEILRKMDIVVASIHTAFKQTADQIMHRIRSAMENPHIHVLAHPTGRLLGRRPGYQVNLEEIYRLARDTGTWLEINASPDRLDLNHEQVREASRVGAEIVINTDAHDVFHLEEMGYGVLTARRGGLSAQQVINCLPAEELWKRLQK